MTFTDVSPSLGPYAQDRIIERGKQIICQMHMYGTHLMDKFDDSYVTIETIDELSVQLRFRIILLEKEGGGLMNRDCEMGVEVEWTRCGG